MRNFIQMLIDREKESSGEKVIETESMTLIENTDRKIDGELRLRSETEAYCRHLRTGKEIEVVDLISDGRQNSL